jgi:hypothetical protein
MGDEGSNEWTKNALMSSNDEGLTKSAITPNEGLDDGSNEDPNEGPDDERNELPNEGPDEERNEVPTTRACCNERPDEG